MENQKKYTTKTFSSFQRFVEGWLVEQDIDCCDPVLMLQSDFLLSNNGDVLVDHVGKVEDIERTAYYVASVLEKDISFPRLNSSKRNNDYRGFYRDSKLVDLVGDIYKKDVEIFGYQFGQ